MSSGLCGHYFFCITSFSGVPFCLAYSRFIEDMLEFNVLLHPLSNFLLELGLLLLFVARSVFLVRYCGLSEACFMAMLHLSFVWFITWTINRSRFYDSYL